MTGQQWNPANEKSARTLGTPVAESDWKSAPAVRRPRRWQPGDNGGHVTHGANMRWLDRIPYPLLVAATVFMLGAPFLPEPHLVEKARMLAEGRLTRPLDIFDVFWHLLPAILLGLKLAAGRTPRAPD
jgi:hypothetical protein